MVVMQINASGKFITGISHKTNADRFYKEGKILALMNFQTGILFTEGHSLINLQVLSTNDGFNISLNSLEKMALANNENGTEACLESTHFSKNSTRSNSGGSICYRSDGTSCGNQEVYQYTQTEDSSCTEHVCAGDDVSG